MNIKIALTYFRPAINFAVVIVSLLIALEIGARIISSRYEINNGHITSTESLEYYYDQDLNKQVDVKFSLSKLSQAEYSFEKRIRNRGYATDSMLPGDFTLALYDSNNNKIKELPNVISPSFLQPRTSDKFLTIKFATIDRITIQASRSAAIKINHKTIDSFPAIQDHDFERERRAVASGSLRIANRTAMWISEITPKFTFFNKGKVVANHQSTTYGRVIPPKDSALINAIEIPIDAFDGTVICDSILVQSVEIHRLDRRIRKSDRPMPSEQVRARVISY